MIFYTEQPLPKMADTNKSETLCSCLPAWMRTTLRYPAIRILPVVCNICAYYFEATDSTIGSYCVSQCHERPTRMHIINVITCKNCWPIVDKMILSDRGKQYFWIGGATNSTKSIDEESQDFVKMASMFYGNNTGRVCHSKNCNTDEHQNTPRFKICSGCKKASYCSVECQREDWKARHKTFCKLNQGQEVPKEELDSVKGEFLRRKDGNTKNSLEDDLDDEKEPCSCFGDVEMHQYKAFRADHCSNLGCFKATRGPMDLRMHAFTCTKKLVPMHIIPEIYCSEKCLRKAYEREGVK